MNNLKPYDLYKKSNIPFLSEIPYDWEEYPFYSIAYIKSIENNVDEELLSVYLNKGVIKYNQSTGTQVHKPSQDLSKYQLVVPGDLVLNNQQAWRGSVGVSKYRGIVSPAYYVFGLVDLVNPRYGNYLFRASVMVNQYVLSSKGVGSIQRNLYFPFLKRARIPLPPIDVQNKIVEYLDNQLAKINTFIKAKKQLIAVLKEQKQALINIAVTKGIKRNVKTKHSGIDILGEVPIEWEVKPLKYYVKSNTETLGETYNKENEISYIDISTVGFGELKRSPVRYKFGEAPSRARRIVHYGDTIISTVRTYLKSMCFIDENIRDCIVSTGFAVLTPNEQVYPKLLNYVLSSNYFVDSVSKNSIGVSYPAISESKLISLKIALPKDINEQREILNYIHEHTTAINKRLSIAEKEIELINEYRTRLISDVVTGKIDIRNIEVDRIQLYDLPEEIIDTDTIELEETAQNEECEV